MKENKPIVSIKLWKAQNSQRYETFTQFNYAFFLISTIIYTCISWKWFNYKLFCILLSSIKLRFSTCLYQNQLKRSKLCVCVFLFFYFFIFLFIFLIYIQEQRWFKTYYEMQVKMRLKSKTTPYSAITHLTS